MIEEELVRRLSALERRMARIVMPEVGREGVAVYNSANIAVPSGAWTALTFNSERKDDASFHSTVANTSRLTVPTGYDDWYIISGHAEWAGGLGGIYRNLGILLNGGILIAAHSRWVNAAAQSISVATIYYLSGSDFVELAAYQDSGGNLNVNASGNYSPEFRMVRL